MNAALLIDFGSTWTKVRAVDLDTARLIGSAQGPSTVTSDVNHGLDAALAALAGRCGTLPAFRHRLASSSAAGGLRMVTVGLVRELTAEAARRAALGAGARLVGSYANRLTRADVEAIVAAAPDILLLCGGTDGGNSAVILANARLLSTSALACPVIIAGNRAVADEARAQFAPDHPCTICANVMPELDRLDIEPARAAIREVFMRRIVHAKGIDRAAARFDAVLMPTPVAVLEAARLIAEGDGRTPGLGAVAVVDPGGATTDVHSVCSGAPADPGVQPVGLPEPYAKRTVEGDLGMRHNAHGILDTVGLEAIARDAGLAPARAAALVEALGRDVEQLPDGRDESALDYALGRAAIAIAMRRHVGSVETVYTALGPRPVQRGKDLTRLDTLIGTGGVLAASTDAHALLTGALAQPGRTELLPARPRLLLDRDYLLYAIGLLAQVDAPVALALAWRHLEPVGGDGRERALACY